MKLTQKSINSIRVLTSEMISDAQVGDIRSCFAVAPIMFSLFKDNYNFFGGKGHINRDRLVIGDVMLTPLYYALLHSFGISLSVEELKTFGDEHGIAPPMPNIKTPGVEANITSKSQGIPTAVGLALASQSLANKFNAQKFNIISNWTYCFVSLSNLEEGISQEAMAYAGSVKISKLIVFCHVKKEQCGGENLKKKYKAMGWNVQHIGSDSSLLFVNILFHFIKKSEKPTIVFIYNTTDKSFPDITTRTIEKNQVEKLKADLGLNGSYSIPNEVRQFCARTSRKLKVEYSKWEKKVVIYKSTHPQLSEELNEYFYKHKISFSKNIKNQIEELTNLDTANAKIVEDIIKSRKCIMVASVKEKLLPLKVNDSSEIYSKNYYRAKNLVFGNRENSMAEICAGISLYFEAPTYVYAPICLLAQMLSGIEHSAKTNLPVLYTFYQSGSCVNQQKTNIELYGQLEWLNNLKNFNIYKPATPIELLACYNNIYDNEKASCLIMPQQDFQKISSDFDGAKKGAYVMEQDDGESDITIIASGREIYIALEVKKVLNSQEKKVKIVSMPSLTIFENQPQKYKNKILDFEKEKVVVITTTNNFSINKLKLLNYTFININEFTNSPEVITSDLIKNIVKKIS